MIALVISALTIGLVALVGLAGIQYVETSRLDAVAESEAVAADLTRLKTGLVAYQAANRRWPGTDDWQEEIAPYIGTLGNPGGRDFDWHYKLDNGAPGLCIEHPNATVETLKATERAATTAAQVFRVGDTLFQLDRRATPADVATTTRPQKAETDLEQVMQAARTRLIAEELALMETKLTRDLLGGARTLTAEAIPPFRMAQIDEMARLEAVRSVRIDEMRIAPRASMAGVLADSVRSLFSAAAPETSGDDLSDLALQAQRMDRLAEVRISAGCDATGTVPQEGGTFAVTFMLASDQRSSQTESVDVVWLTPSFLGRIPPLTVFEAEVEATNAVAYSLVSGPAWLVFDSQTRRVTGLAPRGGGHAFVIRAFGPGGEENDRRFSFWVEADPDSPIDNANLDQIAPVWNLARGLPTYLTINTPIQYAVEATDDSGLPVIYRRVSGSPWLLFDPATGIISGTTPATSAQGSIEIEARDPAGNTSTRVFTTTVPGRPVFTAVEGDILAIGTSQAFQRDIQTSGATGRVLFTLVDGPAWLTAGESGTDGRGVISGTGPSSNGFHPFTLRATSLAGDSSERSFFLRSVVGLDNALFSCLTPGSTCADGTIYVGTTVAAPTQHVYALPRASQSTTKRSWGAATSYCGALVAHGHSDWVLPLDIAEYRLMGRLGDPAGVIWSGLPADYAWTSYTLLDLAGAAAVGGYQFTGLISQSAWGTQPTSNQYFSHCVRRSTSGPDTAAPVWVTPLNTFASLAGGTSLSVVLQATDASEVAYVTLEKPEWVSVDPITGAVTGLVPYAIGTDTLQVRAVDVFGNTTDRTFTLQRVGDVRPPVWGALPETIDLLLPDTVSQILTATDDRSEVSFSLVSPPGLAAIEIQDGVHRLVANPPLATETYTLTVRASDAAGNIASRTLTLSTTLDVIAPTWTTRSETIAAPYTGAPFSATLVATDNSTRLTYEMLSGPAWITVGADGSVSGTAPLSAGVVPFMARVSDPAGLSATRKFGINVRTASGSDPENTDAPRWVSPQAGGNAASIPQTTAIATTLEAAHPQPAETGPLTYGVVATPPLAGLSVESGLAGNRGRLSGILTGATGIYAIELSVSDVEGNTAWREVTIEVLDPPPPLLVVWTTPMEGAEIAAVLPGQAFDVGLSATLYQGGTAFSETLTYSVLTDQAVSVVGNRLQGRVAPGAPQWELALTASSSTGVIGERTVYVRVIEDTEAPVWSTAPDLGRGPIDLAMTRALLATDNSSVVTYTLVSSTLPGATIHPTTGVLSVTPDALGNQTITVRASDPSGNASERSFALRISNDITPPVWQTASYLGAIGPTQALALSVLATDDSGSVSYSVLSKPAWITVNPTTGALSGTPGNTNIGGALLVLRASDEDGNVADRSFSLSVNCLLVGERCADGSYLIDATSGARKFVAPVKRPPALWSTASNLCSTSRLYGRTAWRLPTRAELQNIFNVRASIPTPAGSDTSYYWSSEIFSGISYYANRWSDHASATSSDRLNFVCVRTETGAVTAAPSWVTPTAGLVLEVMPGGAISQSLVATFTGGTVSYGLPQGYSWLHISNGGKPLYSSPATMVETGAAPRWVTPAGSIGTAPSSGPVALGVLANDESATVSYNLLSGPPWLAVNSTTGAITGTPAAGLSGSVAFSVRATDGAGNHSDRAFSLVLDCENPGDLCADGSFLLTPPATSMSYMNAVKRATNFWSSASSVCTSGTYNGKTGWVLPSIDGFRLAFDIKAKLPLSPTDTALFWTSELHSGTSYYVYRWSDFAWSTSSEMQPFFCTRSAAPSAAPGAVLVGSAPIVPGDYPVTLSAMNSLGNAAMRAITIRVLSDGTPPLWVTGENLGSFPPGALLVQEIAASDDSGATFFSIVGSSSALSFSATRPTDQSATLVGALPSSPGPGTITIRASDLSGNFTDRTFTFTIEASDTSAPVWQTPRGHRGRFATGQTVSMTVLATDDSNDIRYTKVSGPNWLTVGATSGLVSGLPSSNLVGVQTVTVRAQDPAGNHTDRVFSFSLDCLEAGQRCADGSWLVQTEPSRIYTDGIKRNVASWSVASSTCTSSTSLGRTGWTLPSRPGFNALFDWKSILPISPSDTGYFWTSELFSQPSYYVRRWSDNASAASSDRQPFVCVRSEAAGAGASVGPTWTAPAAGAVINIMAGGEISVGLTANAGSYPAAQYDIYAGYSWLAIDRLSSLASQPPQTSLDGPQGVVWLTPANTTLGSSSPSAPANFAVTARAANGAVSYSKVSGPAWMGVNSTSGRITGTPPSSALGSVQITVRASSSGGGMADRTFNLNVDCLSAGEICADGTYFLGQSASTNLYMDATKRSAATWSVASSTCTNLVAGGKSGWVLPSQDGFRLAFDFRSSLPLSPSDTNYFWTNELFSAPSYYIRRWTDFASATSSDRHPFFCVRGVAVPGLVAQTARLVGQAPQTPGDYPVTLAASNALGVVTLRDITVRVAPDTTSPAWTTSADLGDFVAGAKVSLPLAATDASGVVTFSRISGPTSLTLSPERANGQTATLTGTMPSVPGPGTVTLRAMDGAGNVSDQVFTYRILASDTTAPNWVTPEGLLGRARPTGSVSFSVAATDDSGVVSYSLISGPSWLTVGASNGLLSGTPGDAGLGLAGFLLRASDPAGNSSTRAFSIAVDCMEVRDRCADGSWLVQTAPSRLYTDGIKRSAGPWATASNVCSTSNALGRTGWTLPSQNQFNAVFDVKSVLPITTGDTSYFWTTDPNGTGVYFSRRWSDNAATTASADSLFSFICLRSETQGTGSTVGPTWVAPAAGTQLSVSAGDPFSVALSATAPAASPGTVGYSLIDGFSWTAIGGGVGASGPRPQEPFEAGLAPIWISPSGVLGVTSLRDPQSFQLTAWDDGGEVSFARVDGPSWITVSTSGRVTGTPPGGTLGSVGFTVRATDAGGRFTDRSFSLTVDCLALGDTCQSGAIVVGQTSNGRWIVSDNTLRAAAVYATANSTCTGSTILGMTGWTLPTRFEYRNAFDRKSFLTISSTLYQWTRDTSSTNYHIIRWSDGVASTAAPTTSLTYFCVRELDRPTTIPAASLVGVAPMQAGSYPVTLGATSPAGGVSLRTLTINVTNPDTTPPAFSGPSDLGAFEPGDAIDAPLTASDDAGSVQFALISGPSWLTVDSAANRLVGSAGAEGVYTVSVSARDPAGNTALRDYTLRVNPDLSPPAWITGQTLGTVYTLAEPNLRIEARDPSGPPSYELVSGPAWISIDPETGLLGGAPAVEDVGAVALTVAAIDPVGNRAERSFSLLVSHSITPVGLDLRLRPETYAGTTTWASDVGTLTGTMRGNPRSAPGASGYIRLDGINDEIWTNAVYPGLSDRSFSLGIWFRTTSRDVRKLIGFERDDYGQAYDKHLFIDAEGRLAWGVWTGSRDILRSTSPVNDGAWHYAVINYTPQGTVLYLDGNEVASFATASVDTANRLRIGGFWLQEWEDTEANGYFQGDIGEVTLYLDRTLGDGDVRRHDMIGRVHRDADNTAVETAPFDGIHIGWEQYGFGEVEYSSTQTFEKWNGLFTPVPTVRKFTNGDPSGGYKLLREPVPYSNLVVEFWIRRENPRSGPASDRIAISGSDFDGLGLNLNPTSISYELRVAGSAVTTGFTAVTASRTLGAWERVQMVVREDGANYRVRTTLHRANGVLIASLSSLVAKSSLPAMADRFVIHGGAEYYIADLQVRTDDRQAWSEPPNSHAASLDIYNWVAAYNATGFASTLSRDTSQRSPAGGVPLRMAVTGGDPHTQTYSNVSGNPTIAPAFAGQTWRLRVLVRADQPTTVDLFIFGADSTGQWAPGGVIDAAGITRPVGTEWSEVTFTFTFSQSFVRGVQVRLDGPHSGGVGRVLWWDNLRVEMIGG